ncbi:MAG: adenine phosphoribosyltransferase [Clostridiales bacterium]|nr:adenine phosphoribosyltransferase [Clostridiales bacterium]
METKEFYTVDICGRQEQLPVLPLPSGARIAFFNLHGNVELTEYCAKELAKRLKDAEVLLTAESKGLQLTHCIARELGHKYYAVARKSKKLYMQDGIETSVKSITTAESQHFYLSAYDAALLKGKRVALVDDVISTGGSMHGLSSLAEMSRGFIAYKAAVLAEGDAALRTDITFLGKIPLL